MLLCGLVVFNVVYNGCYDLKSIGEFIGMIWSIIYCLVIVLVE